ncbi:MAG TPA: phosphohistidine phosphatase SixA [Nitrospirae bacterium]|nr:phosphohistidine phosphatase SixA [bacterium BMS3Abin08]HDY71179.1 phosphohistidine phosphatase SixA [Nitrospirota bacterium]
MCLYLVQHTEPKSKEEDPERPLSEKGLQEIRKVALHLSWLNIGVDRILHSGKLRAKQTAEALSEELTPPEGLSGTDGLAPLNDPVIWAGRLKEMTGDIMLVGHLPHLEKLASLLLCGDRDKKIVTFRMGGVVCLKREDNGDWSLQWILTPEMAR